MAENKRVGHARYSALHSKNQCRLWAWLTYREEAPGFLNHYAKIGTAVHEVMEDYGKHCLTNKLETDLSYLNAIKFKYITQLPEEHRADAKQIVDGIANGTNWGKYFDMETIIERRFYLNKDFEPCEKEDAYISSGIDFIAIDGDIACVQDYKSVRSVYTRSYMEESLQRKLYSYIVLKHFPSINVASFSFNFLRYGFSSEGICMGRDCIDELECEIRPEIEDFYKLIAETEPPEASPGGHCILCEARARCEAYCNAYSFDQRIDNAEDAVNVYKRWRIAQIKAEAAEAVLKEWINQNSPIRFDGEEYGPKAENSIKYNDIGKLLNIFEGAGVPIGAIHDALTINNTKVKGIIKRFKLSSEIQKKIDAVASKGKTTKFKLSKVEYKDTDECEDFIADPYL
jgi:hypothetical protein